MDKVLLKRYILSKKITRLAIFDKSFLEFCKYYFESSFFYPFAPFHYDFFDSLESGKKILFIGFREAAKSMLTMWYVIWCICNNKRKYIIRANNDHSKSSLMLYKIRQILQENKKINIDYGSLFFEPEEERIKRLRKGQKRSQRKQSVNEFICTNGVFVQAQSMGTSTRGLNHLQNDIIYRPDLYVGDDLDTTDSVRNSNIVERLYNKVRGESFGGLASYCQIVLLGNVIGEDGLVPRFEKDYKKDWDYYRIPSIIHDKNICFVRGVANNKVGTFTRDRVVQTREQATLANKKYQEKTGLSFLPFVSLEELRRKDGEIGFGQNQLLIPYVDGSVIIRKSMVKRYNTLPVKNAFCRIIMGVDPAFSEATTADRLGIVITMHQRIDGITKKYVFFQTGLEGVEKDRESVGNYIQNLYQQYKVDLVNIEINNGGSILAKDLVKKGMNVNGRSTGKDKALRLIERQTNIENGDILFNPRREFGECLALDEMTSFPNGANDDVMDAVLISVEDVDVVTKKTFQPIDKIKNSYNDYLSD